MAASPNLVGLTPNSTRKASISLKRSRVVVGMGSIIMGNCPCVNGVGRGTIRGIDVGGLRLAQHEGACEACPFTVKGSCVTVRGGLVEGSGRSRLSCVGVSHSDEVIGRIEQ